MKSLKSRALFGVTLGVGAYLGIGAVTVALAATLLVSNILSLGTTQLSVQSVRFTATEPLPSTMRTGHAEKARFLITNEAATIPAATLVASLKAGDRALTDPTIAAMTFKDPVTGREGQVDLAVAGNNLEAILKSPWAIPAGYQGQAEIRLTLNRNAPAASYSVDVWLKEAEASSPELAGAPGNAIAPQVHAVQLADSDAFAPRDLTIRAGDAVVWSNVSSRPHNITFSSSSVQGLQFMAAGQTYQVILETPGVYSYRCEFHSGMTGSIVVQ